MADKVNFKKYLAIDGRWQFRIVALIHNERSGLRF
jgi:hypothetical protein